MERIKVAQIGMAHDHAPCAMGSLRKQSELFEVIGYAEPNQDKMPEGAWRMKAVEGIPQMRVEELLALPGLEAVVVECFERDLTKYALMAAKRGLHVYMDKPGGCDLAEFEELIRTVKASRKVFQPGYMYRYNPAVRHALELARSGKLGEICCVEAHMDCLHVPDKRQWLGNFKGGMMFFLGCHLIDLIMQFQGEPEKIVPLNRPTGFDGVTGEDYGFALLEYPHGISFAKTCAAEINGFARRQLVVSGTLGTVEIKPLEVLWENQSDITTEMTETFYDDIQDKGWRNCAKAVHFPPFDRYDAMLADFAHVVRGEKQSDYSLDYELALFRNVLRASGVI